MYVILVLFQELGPTNAYIGETLFSFIFCSFLLWTFHPFIFHVKRIYTVLVWYRCFAVLVLSQILRIASFLFTQLPGPNYHCREGSKMASLPAPRRFSEVLMLNFPYGVVYGCGDLVFSSHMIFTLVFVWTYQKFGSKRWIKQLAWTLAMVLSVLIIASRKHYRVDVVIACILSILYSFLWTDNCMKQNFLRGILVVAHPCSL
ncbi:hypothetical protein KP509_29G069300 [Ceratopteris richardii]|uniref:Sphingomyelin synthase-like domain-containing protein n=1 Tax=Ceratopteris richardii TaxID=49495 RepID=A0A8T2R9J0_CERRI|nr:hypothetical protein KP509_29G069300 [Ceratopteris richardii]